MWGWLKSGRDRDLEEATLRLEVAKKLLDLGERSGGLTPETRKRIQAEADEVMSLLLRTRRR